MVEVVIIKVVRSSAGFNRHYDRHVHTTVLRKIYYPAGFLRTVPMGVVVVVVVVLIDGIRDREALTWDTLIYESSRVEFSRVGDTMNEHAVVSAAITTYP